MLSGRARYPVLIGLSFVITGIAYGVLAVPLGYHVEFAGVTLLPALGVALGMLAYVLTAGSSD